MERVLVIDDEEEIRGIVKHHLSKAGYEVIEAEDGEQAIKRLRRGTTHLKLIV